jgi:hypothetical protein
VDVRLVVLTFSAEPDGSHRIPLGDDVSLRDPDRPEMYKRHRVPVARLDRHDLAARTDGSGERHGAGGRRSHIRPLRAGHVDAAVLTALVRVIADNERFQHVSARRP